ncbi:MAG: hypothetical protein M3N16_06250 [Actinomycetota bacterium]|nr:hypothetical protein [Actinomycetota bacterium]
MLVVLATYAVLLICWSLAMRYRTRWAATEAASGAAEGLEGAEPWAELDAGAGPAGPPRAAAPSG